jgi:hypothetical protein
MKLLEDFVKNGFYYEQVRRHANVVIYKQRLRKGEGGLAYEVFHVREREEMELFGNICPAAEYGPSNEDFGSQAFSYPNLARAEAKMDELIREDRFKTKEYLLTHKENGERI